MTREERRAQLERLPTVESLWNEWLRVWSDKNNNIPGHLGPVGADPERVIEQILDMEFAPEN